MTGWWEIDGRRRLGGTRGWGGWARGGGGDEGVLWDKLLYYTVS